MNKNKFNYVYKLYRNEGGMGQSGQDPLTATGDVWRVK
jgi:hypothetical protein